MAGRKQIAGTSRVTKHDVDLAKINASIKTRSILATGFCASLQIAALALPIYALHWVIQPLAGRTTRFDANIAISVTIALSVVINASQYFKGRRQRAEIARMRNRMAELERKELG